MCCQIPHVILLTIELLLLTVPDRKCVGFSLILLCKNRFGFPSELAKIKKSNVWNDQELFANELK